MPAPKFNSAIARSAVAGAAAAVGLWAVSAQAAAPETVHWQVEADRGYSPDVVQFTLTGQTQGGQSTMSSPASLNTLVGLNASQLASSTAQHVAFRVQRDAGEFECQGTAQARRASGECRFTGNRSFAQVLQQRGIGAAQTSDLYRMSVHNVGTSYLDELHRLNYATPTVDQLARAGEHGVSLKYIQEMGAAYHLGNVDGLIMLHDHGVAPEYTLALREAGYPALSAEDIARLHDHGVSAEFMAGLHRAGYSNLRIEDIQRLADHGVSPAWLAGLRQDGYGGLPVDDMVRLRDHGISAGYLAALRAAGYAQLPADQVVRLHEHGVEPGWLAILQKAGYGELPIDQLLTLRDQGIEADYIVALQRSGYRTLTPADVILLRNHGVDADFVRAVVAAGYREASPADIAKMRDHGLTPDQLRRAAALGRPNVDQMIRLRDSGTL